MSLKKLFAAIVIVAAATLIQAGTASPATEQRFSIVAKRYAFIPAEITVKKNVPVVLVLRSEDVTHGLGIRSLGIKQEINKKAPAIVRFTPTQAGDIEAICSHFCGVGHGSMRLTIHVTD